MSFANTDVSRQSIYFVSLCTVTIAKGGAGGRAALLMLYGPMSHAAIRRTAAAPPGDEGRKLILGADEKAA